MAQPAVLGHLVTEFPPLVSPLKSKFDYYSLAEQQDQAAFFAEKGASIRGLTCDTSRKVNKELLSKLPNLEIVSAFSVGTDNVDLPACKERGVVVTNTPDVLSDDVADLALALTLTTMRHIAAADRYVREGLWKSKGSYPLTTQVRVIGQVLSTR
jgi:lactate dehydrogenase-like 2-hydroxyacid dehydrogenase